MDTTVNVDSAVRDRLAVLAAERGLTIRDLVGELAAATPTRAELGRAQDEAAAYVAAQLRPGFDAADAAAGDALWRDLAVGRLPGDDGTARVTLRSDRALS